MKISKTNILISTILLFLTSRVVIDTIWQDSKPTLIVLLYTVFCLLISLHFLIKGRVNIKTSALLLFLFPCTLLISQFNSDVDPFDHVRFALQVFTPCLFLVASTGMPQIMHKASLIYKRRLSAIYFSIILFAAYSNYSNNAILGQSIYEYYQNAPNHVIAQTLLKSSLPLISSGFIWTAVPFITIILLNVRSTILASMLSIIYVNKNQLLKPKSIKRLVIIGIPLIGLIYSQVDWGDLYNRTIFKGRDVVDSTDIIDSASSGRINIYRYYISYIADHFGAAEWLFGVGPIWTQAGETPLSAHNDILNLLISFGLFGLLSTLFCYFYFFSKLPSAGRSIFLLAFMALFLTNGVVFHQSNILFCLLYIYSNIDNKKQMAESIIKCNTQPVRYRDGQALRTTHG